MKLQSIVYTVLSTALTAVHVHAIPYTSKIHSRTPPSLDAPLPPGWRVAGPCMVLNDASNLRGEQWDIVYNTPEACATYCSTAPTNYPPQYTYAAVGGASWGCFCGFDSDYNQVLARRAYDQECGGFQSSLWTGGPCASLYALATTYACATRWVESRQRVQRRLCLARARRQSAFQLIDQLPRLLCVFVREHYLF